MDFLLYLAKPTTIIDHYVPVAKGEMTDKAVTVVMDERTDGRTDGCYQKYYLPSYAVDNKLLKNNKIISSKKL